MQAAAVATWVRGCILRIVCLVTSSAMLFVEPLWAQDEAGLSDAATELSREEIMGRAQDAAVDLADSLRAVESVLPSADSISVGPRGLTKEQKHQLAEGALKGQLDGISGDLDDLSAALDADDGAAATALLKRLTTRKANLIAVLRMTQTPLIPEDDMPRLMERWKDLEGLSTVSEMVDEAASR